MPQEIPTLYIEGAVLTNSNGLCQLVRFYQEASKYHDTILQLDFSKMSWIDANLCALMYAICYLLKREKNITVHADFNFLYKKFNILFQNGWLKYQGITVKDIHETTIPCAYFEVSQGSEFIDYIENKLMSHRGMSSLAMNMRKKIQSDLIELFNNVFLHSNTTHPLFICGQFYSIRNRLILTMVDLGVGFLPPIKKYTKEIIKTSKEAIRWALQGNSSRIIDPKTQVGGFGLQGIYDYFKGNKGSFQIYTGYDFFDTDLGDLDTGYNNLAFHFGGSIVNLMFDFNY